MSAQQELQEWSRLLNKFRGEANAIMDINKQIADSTKRMWKEMTDSQEFALEMGYISEEEYFSWLAQYRDTNYRKWSEEYNKATLELKKYTDSFYDDALKKLNDYEKEFDTWISHSVKMGELNSDEQIHAFKRFADNYNAMVSEIVMTTQLGADEVSSLWDKAYEIRNSSEESIYGITGGKYEKWQSDMDNWIDIRSTYDDWELYGDSLAKTYARAVGQIEEFYDDGVISWQEREDKKLEYSLKMYRAASDEYDEILSEQQERIDELRDKFREEESDLRSSWEVSDRREELGEVNRLLSIYKNAGTDSGQEKYKELLRRKEQLEREEELYQLEMENNAIIEKLEAEYRQLESGKSQVLSRLKVQCGEMVGTGVGISVTSKETLELAKELGINYKTSAESTLTSLSEIVGLLGDIKEGSKKSSNTYNDNKVTHIYQGTSDSVSTEINGTIVSGMGTVIWQTK